MNNIFIPIKNYRNSIGGPSTFMRNLLNYLNSKKIKFIKAPWKLRKAKGIFFPISYDKYILSFFRDNKLPIIQRLDGIYYPSKHGKEHIDLNKDIKDIYQNYSSYVIFQSKYCREQCFKMFGKLPGDKYSIIYNGADNNIFYPNTDPRDKIGNGIYSLVTTGNFRNIDMLEPIIRALDILKDGFKFELTIIGPIINSELERLVKEKKYIRTINGINLKKVADVLRSSDIFLYSHLNPPCPNSVIEAISCGLPVVGFDSGSMSELLFFSKDLLAPVSKKTFQEYEEFDPLKLKDKIEYAFNNFGFIRQRALDNSSLYPFEKTGNQYIEIFNKLNSTK